MCKIGKTDNHKLKQLFSKNNNLFQKSFLTKDKSDISKSINEEKKKTDDDYPEYFLKKFPVIKDIKVLPYLAPQEKGESNNIGFFRTFGNRFFKSKLLND
jgi:hypothetical protein